MSEKELHDPALLLSSSPSPPSSHVCRVCDIMLQLQLEDRMPIYSDSDRLPSGNLLASRVPSPSTPTRASSASSPPPPPPPPPPSRARSLARTLARSLARAVVISSSSSIFHSGSSARENADIAPRRLAPEYRRRAASRRSAARAAGAPPRRRYDVRFFETVRATKQPAWEAFVVGRPCTAPADGSAGCVRLGGAVPKG